MSETKQNRMRGEQEKKWKVEYDGPNRPVSLVAIVCKHMKADIK